MQHREQQRAMPDAPCPTPYDEGDGRSGERGCRWHGYYVGQDLAPASLRILPSRLPKGSHSTNAINRPIATPSTQILPRSIRLPSSFREVSALLDHASRSGSKSSATSQPVAQLDVAHRSGLSSGDRSRSGFALLVDERSFDRSNVILVLLSHFTRFSTLFHLHLYFLPQFQCNEEKIESCICCFFHQVQLRSARFSGAPAR